MEGGKNDGPCLFVKQQSGAKTIVCKKGMKTSSKNILLLPGVKLKYGVTIQVCNAKGEKIYSYALSDVLVTKWNVDGFDALNAKVLIESFEFTYLSVMKS